MPSVFTHIVVPLAIGFGLGKKTISPRLLIAGMLASVLPDFDVIGFRFGIEYASQWGHRGFSHSIVFALCCGLLAMLLAKSLKTTPIKAFLFVVMAGVSHPLLDAMSNGGLGVALFWPFDDTRHFFTYRPIEVAHIGLRFFKEDSFVTLKSELLYVWCPAVLLYGVLFVFSRNRKATYS
jgi:inner membrane protein